MFSFLITNPAAAYEDLTGQDCILDEQQPVGCVCQTEQVPYSRKVPIDRETATRVFYCTVSVSDDYGTRFLWDSECCFSPGEGTCIHEFRNCHTLAENSQSDVDGSCPTRTVYETLIIMDPQDLLTCSDPSFGFDLGCDLCGPALDFLSSLNALHLLLQNKVSLILDAIDKIALNLLSFTFGSFSSSVVTDYFQMSGQLLICPASLYDSQQNFVYHLVDVSRSKFPLDVLGTFPDLMSFSNAPPEITLAFGVKVGMEPILEGFATLKIPVLIAFIVYALVKL